MSASGQAVPPATGREYRISVDCGGTFTDGILLSDAHEVWAAKADSTPADPKAGVVECISRLGAQVGLTLPDLLAATKTIVLGTTLATNIVATRTGAKTGAITTRGYRDRLSFLHVAKSDLGGDRKATAAELFSFRSEFPQPLAPRHWSPRWTSASNFKGEVLTPLRDDDVRRAVAYLKRKGVEAIAVNLLFSHLNPAHELRVEEIIKEEYPEAYVALSSRVLPTVGEVGRWSTTMFSAYVAPKITEFVNGISAVLADDGFAGSLAFMQSNGGVATGEVVCENPAALLVSGPAAGPALGVSLGQARGVSDLVTADMGGDELRYLHHPRRPSERQPEEDHRRQEVRPADRRRQRGRGGRGQHRLHRHERPPAGGPGQRRRRSRAGLLWTGRDRADRHRRQPGVGLSQPRLLPGRRPASCAESWPRRPSRPGCGPASGADRARSCGRHPRRGQRQDGRVRSTSCSASAAAIPGTSRSSPPAALLPSTSPGSRGSSA